MLSSGWLDGVPPDLVDANYPALARHRKMVGSLPAVRTFYAGEEGLREAYKF
jgi:hypothetical protein